MIAMERRKIVIILMIIYLRYGEKELRTSASPRKNRSQFWQIYEVAQHATNGLHLLYV